jgi:N-methylhydantoinase A/oxoprolinase/acetone carboxylase beta subunit
LQDIFSMTQEVITAKALTENNRDTKVIPNVLSQEHQCYMVNRERIGGKGVWDL